MSVIGYVRTYKSSESTTTQINALLRAGCQIILKEHQEASDTNQPVLYEYYNKIQTGDKLVVVRLDRLSKSQSVQLQIIDYIISKGGNVLSLRDGMDTAFAPGRRRLHTLRVSIEGDRISIDKNDSLNFREANSGRDVCSNNYPTTPQIPTEKRARHIKFMQEISAAEADWLPHVKALRPNAPWEDVVSAINADNPNSGPWTRFRLQRAVRAYVGYGFISRCVLEKQRLVSVDRRLLSLVHSIRTLEPTLTVTEICRRLEATGEPAPRGGKKWNHSVVAALLKRAEIVDAGNR